MVSREIIEKKKTTRTQLQNERERKQCYARTTTASTSTEAKQKKNYVVIMPIYPIFSAPVYLESLFTFGE